MNEELRKKIEALETAAKQKFAAAYKAFLTQHDATWLIEYSYARFDLDTRKDIYTYQVSLLYKIMLDDNEYYEDDTADGKPGALVSLDPQTGKKSYIISNSHKGVTLFRAVMPVRPNDLAVEEIKTLDAAALAKININQLEGSETWKFFFEEE
jgi:hypothetical protein